MLSLIRKLAVRSLRGAPKLTLLLVVAVTVPCAAAVGAATIQETASFSVTDLRRDLFGEGRFIVRTAGEQGGWDEAERVMNGRAEYVRDMNISLEFSAAGRERRASGRMVDITSPVLAGAFRFVAGQPSGDGVTLSQALADELGVTVGQHVSALGISDALIVTAVVTHPVSLSEEYFLLAPPNDDAFLHLTDLDHGSPRWLVGQVTDLNVIDDLAEAGFVVTRTDTVVADMLASLRGMTMPWAVIGLVAVVSGALLIAGLAVHARHLRKFTVLLDTVGAPQLALFLTGAIAAIIVAAAGVIIGASIGVAGAYPLSSVLARQMSQDWGAVIPSWRTVLGAASLILMAAVANGLLVGMRPRTASPRLRPYVLGGVCLVVAGATTVTLTRSSWALAGVVLGSAGCCLVVGSVWLWVVRRLRVRSVAQLGLRESTGNAAVSMAVFLASAIIAAMSIAISSATLQGAERQESATTGVAPVGAALIRISGPVPDNAIARVGQKTGAATGRFAPLGVRGPGGEVIPAVVNNRVHACVTRTGDIRSCIDRFPDDPLNAGVAVVQTATEVEAMTGPLTPEQRTAFLRGDGLFLTSRTGEDGGEVGLAPVAGPNVGPVEFEIVLSLIPVQMDRHYSALPVVVMSAAAAERHGLVQVPGATYVVCVPPGTDQLTEQAVRDALPLQLGEIATVTVSQTAEQASTLRGVSVATRYGGLALAIVVATIAAVIWSIELRASLRLLNTVGARGTEALGAVATRISVVLLPAIVSGVGLSVLSVLGLSRILGADLAWRGVDVGVAWWFVVPVVATGVGCIVAGPMVDEAPPRRG